MSDPHYKEDKNLTLLNELLYAASEVAHMQSDPDNDWEAAEIEAMQARERAVMTTILRKMGSENIV